jgi:hypothetical protein
VRVRASALAAVAAAVYLPALWAGFVADDFVMLRAAEGVSDPAWPFARDDLGAEGAEADHFYRPLWVLWNSLILQVSGDAAVFHAAGLGLFALVTVEVWALARTLAGEWSAWLAGLAFAVYPRHGETVAWVSGSTDLLATAFGLASLLCLMAPWRGALRIGAATGLAVAAALAKESGFVLPALALLVLLLAPESNRRELRARWRAPVVMAGALVAVLAIRWLVLDGLGGYGDDSVTPARVAAAAGSYALAVFTPPQLEVLRYPLLLAVPAALAALAAWSLWRVRRDGDGSRLRVVLLGLAWFAVGLVPVLGTPLDLNTATGERLLFLPSVGLALALGAALPSPRSLRGRLALGLSAALLAGLCLTSAANWVKAGDIAERVTRDAVRLAPDGGRLTLLSIPESYRNAHVFTNGFDLALARAAGRDVPVSWCIPVQVRSERPGQVAFRALPDGSFEGSTTWSAPFDYPVVGDPSPLTPGCGYGRVGGARGTIGLKLAGIARPLPGAEPAVYVVFDGERLVTGP